jgi:hypothetical protein
MEVSSTKRGIMLVESKVCAKAFSGSIAGGEVSEIENFVPGR